MSGSESNAAKGRVAKTSKAASEKAATTLTGKSTSKKPGRSSSGGYKLTADGRAKTGSRGKTLNPVTGRFITKPQARAATPAPPARGNSRQVVALASTTVPDARPRGKAETTGRSDEADLAAALEIITGSGKTETLSLSVEMREYLDELRTQLESLVLPSVLARIAKGATAVSPSVLARRMLAVAPAPAPVNKMAEQVGPEFYDTNGVAAILAGPGKDPVSKQAVEQRRRRHTIVALPTAEGRWIYPTWQFDGNDVIAGLTDVLAAFHTTAAPVATKRSETAAAPFDEWSVGTWLTTPRDSLGGLTAVDLLRGDLDEQRLDHLLTLARHTAAAWAV